MNEETLKNANELNKELNELRRDVAQLETMKLNGFEIIISDDYNVAIKGCDKQRRYIAFEILLNGMKDYLAEKEKAFAEL